MNLREQIGQLFMVGFDGLEPPPLLTELIRDYYVGGVILYRRNIESSKQLCELMAGIREAAGGRKLLIGVDNEGGRVFRLPPPFTQFPAMAKVTDEDSAYKIGKKMAEELRSVGINVNFAPILDVNTNIKNPVIGDRSFSSDARVVARLGCALIKGLQDGRVIACGKHFPGHGDTDSDSHLELPHLSHTMPRLEAIELVPFQAAISSGVKSLMTAHVVYDGIDPSAPATLSPIIINNLLRERLGFDGVVFTDDLRMRSITEMIMLPSACVRALTAGCDVCLICRDNASQKEAIEYTMAKVTAGHLPEKVIESAIRRVRRIHLKNDL